MNFFRPTFVISPSVFLILIFRRLGGEVAVDINDVAHALQKVIPKREAEDTWQIDSFGGVSLVSNRAPDEVRTVSTREWHSDWLH